jgi:hypothetical protein
MVCSLYVGVSVISEQGKRSKWLRRASPRREDDKMSRYVLAVKAVLLLKSD